MTGKGGESLECHSSEKCTLTLSYPLSLFYFHHENKSSLIIMKLFYLFDERFTRVGILPVSSTAAPSEPWASYLTSVLLRPLICKSCQPHTVIVRIECINIRA